jgi:chromosome partitioning protein
MRRKYIISVASHKGGVGRTTTVAALGALLAKQGEKTLLIDMDSQRNLTSTFLGIKYMPRTTVFDAFCNEADLPIINVGDNLDLVPSSIEMGGLESIIMKRPGRESILAGLLQSIKNLYDIILLDCPSQNWIGMLNSFVASTSVLIPICCDSYAAEGLIQVTQMVELASYSFNPILAVDGIVLTRYNGRRTLDVAIEQELKSHYGSLVMNTRIRENSKLVQAALLGQDIFTYDPDCNGAIDYANLLEEIKLKLEKI